MVFWEKTAIDAVNWRFAGVTPDLPKERPEDTMNEHNSVRQRITEIRETVMGSGYYPPSVFDGGETPLGGVAEPAKIRAIIEASRHVHRELENIAGFVNAEILDKLTALNHHIENPEDFSELAGLLERLVNASMEFRFEQELVYAYGDLLAAYIMTLRHCGSPGRKSPVIELILTNIARRKAAELDQSRFQEALKELGDTITIALIAKRYAVYVLATRGTEVLFRGEIDFRTFGTSPEGLALQIINLLLKNGVKLSEVTDITCGGGDLGTLPDGIYVLTQRVRDESWKRLHNSSLNRGALVGWELREILRHQGDYYRPHSSLCSPLSFSTLDPDDLGSIFSQDAKDLRQRLQGYVKVTPLKSTAALLSQSLGINQENLNLLVMSLDELFASAVRKTGPRIVREMAAQDANRILINFDFVKIVDSLNREGFKIPPTFRLASRELGTGVKEVCELLMILESGNLSSSLARNLMHVVDSYARRVAMVLETASAGPPTERPHFIIITSMLAEDPYFRRLFGKIRDRIDNPFTPIMCLDSLEHEYLVADQLFEMYVNPARGDKRLHFTVEARSMKHALQVLGAAGGRAETFSFASLLDEVTAAISDKVIRPANLVLVGGDNEDALLAVANAKDHGLLNRIALLGDPEEIQKALAESKILLSPRVDPKVEIIAIDPLAVDFEQKKKSLAEVFRGFLKDHPDYVVVKGSVDTATLLHQALSIYKSQQKSGPTDEPARKRLASNTALFVLPDGRFFALSDAGVNPSFRGADDLLLAIENQVDVVRKVVSPELTLKVAIVTAVEKETAAIPATLLAAEAEQGSKRLEEAYGPLIVEGPLSFDLATAPGVAEEKHYQGRIMGDANCLMATDINTANVLYKMLSKTMGSLGLMIENGAIITAGPGTVPIVLTSRGDTAQTKFNSILLALAYAARSKQSGQAS